MRSRRQTPFMTRKLLSWLRQASQDSLAEPTEPTVLAQYNTHDARNVFSHLIQRVRRGEEIVIAHAGRPVAKLIPHSEEAGTRPGFLRVHLLVNDALDRDEVEPATPTRSSQAASRSHRA